MISYSDWNTAGLLQKDINIIHNISKFADIDYGMLLVKFMYINDNMEFVPHTMSNINSEILKCECTDFIKRRITTEYVKK